MESSAEWRKRKMLANLDEITEMLEWFGLTPDASSIMAEVVSLRARIEAIA